MAIAKKSIVSSSKSAAVSTTTPSVKLTPAVAMQIAAPRPSFF
ncbi:hypothetical protein [Granulicella sibirica]|uniref:Uncharacterized protein n=1 Tax=Granulicella sibirica TaxID=2479048 RepID=A0A4Q0T1Z6_9BACT|nr:hypothetical protein [Granulicella sibirica]RXH55476.1 hypothetical protein GRAN_2333 [Granulicella sibirica]